MTQYKQSKTGMWHLMGTTYSDNTQYQACRNGNLDFVPELVGEAVAALPEGAKLCKRCASHLNAKPEVAPKAPAAEVVVASEVVPVFAYEVGTVLVYTRTNLKFKITERKAGKDAKRNKYQVDFIGGATGGEYTEAELNKDIKNGEFVIK